MEDIFKAKNAHIKDKISHTVIIYEERQSIYLIPLGGFIDHSFLLQEALCY